MSNLLTIVLLVPTRMGMIRPQCRIRRKVKSCPHTHGDDPNLDEANFIYWVLSPHAWG